MAIVVEVLNRGGHVISSHKFDSDHITIGRGLNADLTLHDPHIDAKHLIIDRSAETHNLYCSDDNSLNGVWLLNSKKPGYGITLKNKNRLQQRRLFYSGQQFMLGRTIVRVFAADHPVVAPIPLSRWEEIGHGLSHWAVWMLAMVALVLSQSLDAYLNDPTQKNVLQYILPTGYAVVGALAYAGVWAFVGRNLRHEGKLATHFSVAVLALLILSLLGWLLPIIEYNARLWWASTAIGSVLNAVIAFLAGLLALLYATHLKVPTRIAVALVVPSVMLLSLIIGAITRSDFRSAPQYETALVAPAFQARGTQGASEFISGTDRLFAPATSSKTIEE